MIVYTEFHTVTFGDCDPAMIVFYPKYFQWFDQSCERMFRMVGLGWENMFADYGLRGLPIVDAQASFKAPARMGDDIQLECRIREWRGKTFVVDHRVSKGGDELCTGREIRVWAEIDAGPRGVKAGGVPDEIMARFDD